MLLCAVDHVIICAFSLGLHVLPGPHVSGAAHHVRFRPVWHSAHHRKSWERGQRLRVVSLGWCPSVQGRCRRLPKRQVSCPWNPQGWATKKAVAILVSAGLAEGCGRAALWTLAEENEWGTEDQSKGQRRQVVDGPTMWHWGLVATF